MKTSITVKKQIKQKTALPMVAALVCIALFIASMFLPYLVATAEYRGFMEAMQLGDNISLADYAQVYLDEGDNSVATVLGTMAGLAAVAALFAIVRIPVGVMVFDILATAVAGLVHFIFTSNGSLDSGYFTPGVGSWLIFVAGAGALASAIWMLAAKIKAKKSAAAETEN